MVVRLALGLVAAFAGAVSAAPARRAEAATPYLFAVVPQEPPMLTGARWSPILDRIGRDAGIPLQLKLYERDDELRTDLATGAVDFAYVNSVQAVHAFKAARYRPLLRDAEPIRGVVFVARDSPFTSLESLAGRELAVAGPWSVCLVALAEEIRGLRMTVHYAGTRANAYKHVALGLVPAGGTMDELLADAPPETREKLRVVYGTPAMASHPVVVHPRVPREVADRVASAFRAFRATERGAELLPAVRLGSPVPADYKRDYAPLERLMGLAPPTEPTRRPE